MRGVYPRVCGGTFAGVNGGAAAWGLSPRMRGNLGVLNEPAVNGRSIPAYAGEPKARRRASRASRVYPRVCGGTLPRPAKPTTTQGLSPRMRGNLIAGPRRYDVHRSIPAYAGEPSRPCAPQPPSGVYPRVCGGTWACMGSVSGIGGLSPRMRGNHPATRAAGLRRRSIPAYAGEPHFQSARRFAISVYPRVCGGTV